MKYTKQIIILCLLTCVNVTRAQQFLFVENFSGNTSKPPTNSGWVTKNNSSPSGIGWFYGQPNIFKALTGKDSSYYAANFSSTGANGTISNWLITPTLALVNGNVFEFFTRTTSSSVYADRLQVYLSTAGTGTIAETTGTTVGTFSTLVLDINPSLVPNGYPRTWTSYSFAISGLPGYQTGRIGFRYYVTDGGSAGTNSNFVGIDSVTYFGNDPYLGIGETNLSENLIVVYPNPVINGCTVEGPGTLLELYDANAGLLIKREFKRKQIVDMSHLQKGIYFLNIRDSNGLLINRKKIIRE